MYDANYTEDGCLKIGKPQRAVQILPSTNVDPKDRNNGGLEIQRCPLRSQVFQRREGLGKDEEAVTMRIVATSERISDGKDTDGVDRD